MPKHRLHRDFLGVAARWLFKFLVLCRIATTQFNPHAISPSRSLDPPGNDELGLAADIWSVETGSGAQLKICDMQLSSKSPNLRLSAQLVLKRSSFARMKGFQSLVIRTIKSFA